MSTKRARSPSASPSPSPTSKASRTVSVTSSAAGLRALICTLPPTCNPPRHQPTELSSTKDLESHYATYHAHVCEEVGCGCVFPDGRLLELHQTECHDPLAEVRKERGEKIFACHLVSCNRLFLTPKARRLHLIQAHGYPKEYFFAVTNKGVGGLLKKWGEGATLIRGEWKPRDTQANTSESDNPETETRTSEEVEDSMHIVETRPVVGSSTFVSNPATFTGDEANDSEVGHEDYDLEALRDSMTSLSLVPSAIRFGRGGKAGGFGHRGRSARVPHQSFHYALGDRGGSSGTVTAPLISMTAGTTPPDRSQMSGKDTSGAVYTNAGRGRRIRGAGRRGGSRGSVSG